MNAIREHHLGTASLFSQVDSAAALTSSREIVYEFSRIGMLGGWWGWVIAIAVVATLMYLCVWLYRRDTVELSPGVRATLLWLRLSVVVALVFFFLGLQRRAQQRVTRASEVAVLVDTSQSMSLPDSSDPGRDADEPRGPGGADPRRERFTRTARRATSADGIRV
jgi:hypothetical protein